MNEERLSALKERLMIEFTHFILSKAENTNSAIYEIQPPTSVAKAAASAAANILLAFEVGYCMEKSE